MRAKIRESGNSRFWPILGQNRNYEKFKFGAVIDLFHVIWTLGIIFVIEIQIGN